MIKILTDSERDIYMYKILPVSLISCLIWLLGELIFGMLFTQTVLRESFVTIYFTMWLVDTAIFFVAYFAARAGKRSRC